MPATGARAERTNPEVDEGSIAMLSADSGHRTVQEGLRMMPKLALESVKDKYAIRSLQRIIE